VPTVEVLEVDPHDDDLLARWHAVEAASVRADHPAAAHRGLSALAASVRHPSPYARRVLLVAVLGATPVGVAELWWSLAQDGCEDDGLCGAEIHVPPAERRSGIGRRLWAEVDRRRARLGRSVVEGELEVATTSIAAERSAAGPSFARAMGFEVVHAEEHLVLPLPPDATCLHELTAAATASAADYDVVTWWGRCPGRHVDAYCDLRTRMEIEVDSGGSAREPVVMTPERLRVSEERLLRSYDVVVAAAQHRAGGELVGYSLVFADRDDDEVLQDDTYVLAAHRGHRLGTLLKLATLEALSVLETPRRTMHTWTAPTNVPMLAVNRAFGYRRVAHTLQVQWRARGT